VTTSLSRVVEAFNKSQEEEWAALTSMSQGGGGGGEGGVRGGEGVESEGEVWRAGQLQGSADRRIELVTERSNDESCHSKGETWNTQSNCSSNNEAASDTFHLTSQPSEQHTEHSFFTHGGIMTSTLTLLERACSGGGDMGLFPPLPHAVPLPNKPDMAAFRLFCAVLVRAYENKKTDLLRIIEEGGATRETEEGTGGGKGGETGEGTGGKTDEGRSYGIVQKEREKGDIEMKNTYIKRENSTDNKDAQPTALSIATHTMILQDALQHSLDELDIHGVAAAVSRGAVVYPAMVRQAAQYFGDEHFPLFSLLLTYGELYMAGR
jgi:hypothetical protein